MCKCTFFNNRLISLVALCFAQLSPELKESSCCYQFQKNWPELTFAKTSGTVISVRKTNWPMAHWRVHSNHPRINCGTNSVPVLFSFINCRMSTVSLFPSPFQYVRERSPGNKFAIPSLSVSSPFPAGKAARVTTLPANISGAQRLRQRCL